MGHHARSRSSLQVRAAQRKGQPHDDSGVAGTFAGDSNILRELFQKLDRSRYEAGPAELGVRTGIGVRYPDIIVDRASTAAEGLAGEAPVFTVEVLSPSTAGLDFMVKLGEFKAIDSVQAYLSLQPG